MTNPLLDLTALPLFDRILPIHIAEAVDTLLAEAQAALVACVEDGVPDTFHALSRVLGVPMERLGSAWGAVAHLQSVADTPELRAAFNESQKKVVEFFTLVGSDERLFRKHQRVNATADVTALTAEQRRALDNALRDFRMTGAELTGPAKQRFMEIAKASALLSQQFSEHVLDATDEFAYYATHAEIAGLPEDVAASCRSAAEKDGKAGYKLVLQAPVLFPVLQFCECAEVRERLYRANVTRASELGRAELDNTDLIAELLNLRQEQAELLGHTDYASVSLVAKMAESAQEVEGFLLDLARRSRPSAVRDLDDLRRFALDQLNIVDAQSWDLSFAGERLREARYDFKESEVKRYFTLPKVLSGLFEIVEGLFDVTITLDAAATWNPTVSFYRVQRGTELLGNFYFDPYARQGKRSGAWMTPMRGRWVRPDGTLQTPVAHLVCNFASPSNADVPALLTHSDVITLFHEFGHGLHHLLTRVDEIAVAGISGVEWDAVELPSQFMENFCWEFEVLERISNHIDDGSALPRDLFDKMLAAKNFQSGLLTLRQVEMSLFDMRIHSLGHRASPAQQVIEQVRAEVAVMQVPAFNRFPTTFAHVFVGGYAAGYYSYKWAEVLSADVWDAFSETGILDKTVGDRYRREILERGGSRPMIENFKAFRGRSPSIDALLKHQGMAVS